ncbi:MAG: DUF11 domain-containing protein [Chloroflexi bacterium]|nr:DUF11 domain-containing protein [Chloroflexota bacterium]
MIGMIRRILRREDGVTIVMVLAFMALSVPVVTAALGLASTLNIDSRVKGDIAQAQFSAIGANELAIQRLTEDNLPAPDGNGIPDILEEDNNGFDDGDGIPDIWEDVDGDGNPDGYHETIEIDGDLIEIKITPDLPAPFEPPNGEGLVVTKTLVSTSPDPIVSFSTQTAHAIYRIVVENQGTDAIELRRIFDGLPPGFEYKGPSTLDGDPINDPQQGNSLNLTPSELLLLFDDSQPLGQGREMLTWDLHDELEVILDPGQFVTLEFRVEFENLTDGRYCNYAWVEPEGSQSRTGLTAEIAVGIPPSPICLGSEVEVTTTAVAQLNPNELPLNPNDDVEVTYTITIDNRGATDINLWWLRNKLPPGFTYVWNSATGSITSENPALTYFTRQSMNWFTLSPNSVVVPAGTQSSVTFKAHAPRASGLFRNEIWAFFYEYPDEEAPYSWPSEAVFLADVFDIEIGGVPTSQVWVVDGQAFVKRWEISR